VVLDRIVAVATGVPALAFVALHLHVALVVLATKNQLPFGSLVLVLLAVVCAVVWCDGSVCRVRVAFSQVVRVLGVDIGRSGVGRRCMYF
jgi:tetrahydromethanopterin S-methyltransferase subunit C